MMNKAFLTAALLLAGFCVVFAQGEDNKELKMDHQKISGKWSVGFDMNYGEMKAKPSVNVNISGRLAITESIYVGLRGTAVWYDHRLNKLDANRTYHVESAYGGATIQKYWELFNGFQLGLMAYAGTGFIQYKYDGKYREELTWHEEIIDLETFSIFEPGIVFEYEVRDNIGITAHMNYRMTSDIKLIETDNDMMNQVNFGFGLNYYFD